LVLNTPSLSKVWPGPKGEFALPYAKITVSIHGNVISPKTLPYGVESWAGASSRA
jgi:hypothetical protein